MLLGGPLLHSDEMFINIVLFCCMENRKGIWWTHENDRNFLGNVLKSVHSQNLVAIMKNKGENKET